ncbi:hypothetical protein, partial [Nostocoides australiense]|nr:hypothetical protein [Tetrasphaera australiensis]
MKQTLHEWRQIGRSRDAVILLVAAIGSLVTDAMAMVALLLRVHAQSPASWWPRSFSACRRGST